MNDGQILGDSMFSLVPAGDAYWGGRFFQVRERSRASCAS